MILTLAALMQLASVCAPHVAAETLGAIARAESGFDTLAININGGDGEAPRPASREDAIRLATALINDQHRSVDLGLMQINNANLPRLGLSIAQAFDPCLSLGAGSRILEGGYVDAGGSSGAAPQWALRQALSLYNTGTSTLGFTNGYVRRVEAAAKDVRADLTIYAPPGAGGPTPLPALSLMPLALQQPAAAPPVWDVYARAPFAPELVFPAVPLNRRPAP